MALILVVIGLLMGYVAILLVAAIIQVTFEEMCAFWRAARRFFSGV